MISQRDLHYDFILPKKSNLVCTSATPRHIPVPIKSTIWTALTWSAPEVRRKAEKPTAENNNGRKTKRFFIHHLKSSITVQIRNELLGYIFNLSADLSCLSEHG
jgi:hypothetical protein